MKGAGEEDEFVTIVEGAGSAVEGGKGSVIQVGRGGEVS